MLAKTLLHLDAITRKLDPDYDPQRVIRDYAEQTHRRRSSSRSSIRATSTRPCSISTSWPWTSPTAPARSST